MTLTTSIADARLIYRVLHAHLQEHDELMDCELLTQLQTRLMEAARADGVDVSDHAAWNAWLSPN